MSQSDFLIRAGLSSATGNVHTGSALLNNLLSNPLSSSTHCRVLNEENSNSNYDIRGLYFVSSSVSGGSFINIPGTKSVSLRVWGRTNIVTNSRGKVSLLAKHNGFNVANLDTGANPTTGYEFGFNADDYSGDMLYYKFSGYNSSANGNTITGIPGYIWPYSGQIANKWIGLRMDITPVTVTQIVDGSPVTSVYKDIIRFYTASFNAPNTWTQIGADNELLAAGANGFVPWGSYTANNSAYRPGTVATSSYGFYVSGFQNSGLRTYFDDFQMIVEDAF